MIKRGIQPVLVVLFLLVATAAFAQVAEDIQKHPNCPYCGMDRQKFAHSRMLIQYDDGSAFGACSLHCAAVDLALKLDKNPSSIQVGDYNTKKLIDAEKAAWVLGGNKPGVMTKRAKWAFTDPKDAQTYMTENQGQSATFDGVMKATYEDMHADTKMIREKRAKMKQMHQGGNK